MLRHKLNSINLLIRDEFICDKNNIKKSLQNILHKTSTAEYALLRQEKELTWNIHHTKKTKICIPYK